MPKILLFLLFSAAAGAAPTFVTLGRVDGGSHAGVELGLLSFDDRDADVSPISRLDAHGSFRVTEVAGLFGQLAVTRADIGGDSYTEMLPPELGAFAAYEDDGVTVTGRLGVLLPWGSRDFDLSEGEAISRIFGTLARADDLVMLAPDVFWVRPGVSVQVDGGELFARAEVMLDVPFDEDIDDVFGSAPRGR